MLSLPCRRRRPACRRLARRCFGGRAASAASASAASACASAARRLPARRRSPRLRRRSAAPGSRGPRRHRPGPPERAPRPAGPCRPGRPGYGALVVARHLDRVLDASQPPLEPGTEPLMNNQTADRVGADHFEVLLGAVAGAHVARHLLVLENLARILALAGRTVRTVRDRDAVGRAKAARSPSASSRRQSPCPGSRPDVDQLAGDEMVGAKASRRHRAAHPRRPGIRRRFALGSTSALPKAPRCGLATFFALALPAPSWTAV